MKDVFVFEKENYARFTDILTDLLITARAWYLETCENQYRKREAETNFTNAIERFKRMDLSKCKCKEFVDLMNAIDSKIEEVKSDPCNIEKHIALSNTVINMLKAIYII